MTETTLEMLRSHLRRQNSPWELDQIAVLPHSATPWGCYRQLLREIDTRRLAIRDSAIAAEGHRRGALWARLTLRPLRARGLAMAAEDAEAQAIESARLLAHLEARARAVRSLLPEDLTEATIAQLEAEDGLARLAMATREAHGQPALEVARAIEALPDPQRQAFHSILAAPERPAMTWRADYHETPALAPAAERLALEAVWRR